MGQGFFKRIRREISIFFISLFSGMRNADKVMLAQVGSGSVRDTEINHTQEADCVMNDLLKGEVTERVVELRDKYYRILDECDKYIVKGFPTREELEKWDAEDGNPEEYKRYSVIKYGCFDHKHVPVYEPDEDMEVMLIQENFDLDTSSLSVEDAEKENRIWYDSNGIKHIYPYRTVRFEWDGILPRFRYEQYLQSVVFRGKGGVVNRVDLYFPMPPKEGDESMFVNFDGKLSIFLSEIKKSLNRGYLRGDFDCIKGMKWVTSKAWGEKDLRNIFVVAPKVEHIAQFDGKYVITMIPESVHNVYLAEKYKTEELTEKYAKKEQIHPETADLSIIARKKECQ